MCKFFFYSEYLKLYKVKVLKNIAAKMAKIGQSRKKGKREEGLLIYMPRIKGVLKFFSEQD